MADRYEPLSHLGFRNHAAADPGGDGHSVLRTLSEEPAGCAGSFSVPGGRTLKALGGPRLLQPGPQYAEGRSGNLQPGGLRRSLPSAFQDLLSLPGFGTYTAGAVASIAFGQKVPAVDGNALRVLSRLRSDGRPVDEDKTKKAVSAELLAVMEAEKEPYSPGEFNQAFMDLSALICHQNSAPECEKCPLKDLCRAHAVGTESSFPVKNPKKARRVTDLTILRIRDGERGTSLINALRKAFWQASGNFRMQQGAFRRRKPWNGWRLWASCPFI